jgi:hypothetical protein
MSEDDLLGCYACIFSYENKEKKLKCEKRDKDCSKEDIEAGESNCHDFKDQFKRTHYQR